ncbi:hypothetical protein GCM10010345_11160 [Streptomyces canarius]|uniref:Uncharacterized protein n=1 Tax=Streptomyces canarius TaxID=285453 RepID=A0ABQ3CHM6_9ACTN|nr:hypothetical protein GCM10010345_11160 [Streptomyces canarius]
MARQRGPGPDDYLPASGVLDWTDPKRHWAQRPRPCRFCKGPTCLRDEGGRPSHKTCAEAHRARKQAHAEQAYEQRARRADQRELDAHTRQERIDEDADRSGRGPGARRRPGRGRL